MKLVDDRDAVGRFGGEPDSVANLEIAQLCLTVLVDIAGSSDTVRSRSAACLDRHGVAANRGDGSTGPGHVITAATTEVWRGRGGAARRLPITRRRRCGRGHSGCDHSSGRGAGEDARSDRQATPPTGRLRRGGRRRVRRHAHGAFLPVVDGTFPFLSTNLELLCREPADSLAIRPRRPREPARRLAEGARHGPSGERGQWDLDPEAATGSRTGLDVHAPAVSGHEGGDDRQTQSGPSVVTAGRVGSVEPFEYSRCFFWRHAWAVVSDRQDHTAPAGLVVNPAG